MKRKIEAKRYEGNILLSVHAEDSGDITRAREIFSRAGAQNICVTGEAAAPKERGAPEYKSRSAEEIYAGPRL